VPRLACWSCGRQIYTVAPLESLFAEERRCPRCGAFLNGERREDAAGPYLYLFGMFRRKDAGAIEGGTIHLARVRPEAIEKRSAYEYLVEGPTEAEPGRGVRWAREFVPTAPLLPDVPNEMSVSYNAHLGRWIAVRMVGTTNQLALQSAPRITGPWSAPEVFWRPEVLKEGQIFYAAKEHPELAREGGRMIYVTYIDTADYLPRLVEVELKG
jgi:hypothetical protein